MRKDEEEPYGAKEAIRGAYRLTGGSNFMTA